MKIFTKWLDNTLFEKFKRDMEKNSSMPIEFRIVVAEMLSVRFRRTLELMEGGSEREIDLHLHLEGKDAGVRIKELEKDIYKGRFDICKLGEARLSESLYHCLQCVDFSIKEFASAQINSYIMEMESISWAYTDKLSDLMGPKYTKYLEDSRRESDLRNREIAKVILDEALDLIDKIFNEGYDIYEEIGWANDDESKFSDNSVIYLIITSNAYFDKLSSFSYGYMLILSGDLELRECLSIAFSKENNSYSVVLSFEFDEYLEIDNLSVGNRKLRNIGGMLSKSLYFLDSCARNNILERPPYVERAKKLNAKWQQIVGV
jgi:hypothetical protein